MNIFQAITLFKRKPTWYKSDPKRPRPSLNSSICVSGATAEHNAINMDIINTESIETKMERREMKIIKIIHVLSHLFKL